MYCPVVVSGAVVSSLDYSLHRRSILQVPTTQLAKMSIDPKFVKLKADVHVLEIFL